MHTNDSKYIRPDRTIWQASQFAHHKHAWEQITSDRWILQTIMGVNIEFTRTPFQAMIPSENTRYHQFKLETIHTAINLIKQNCYIAFIDLRLAYYAVPVCKEHQNHLRFFWRNILYNFSCLPNGVASVPRKFTKFFKPVYATVRSQCHVSFGYIDDSYLHGHSVRECKSNVDETTDLFERFGFTPRDKMSVLLPTQKLIVLVFLLNSIGLTISLSRERGNKLKTACISLLKKDNPTVDEVAAVVGLMVASFPDSTYGPVFYRTIDTLKTEALRTSKGSFEAKFKFRITFDVMCNGG